MVAAKTYNPYKVFGTEGATKLDIVDILSELRQERDRLEQAIRRLEALSNKKAGTRRRGHRVMSAAAILAPAAALITRWPRRLVPAFLLDRASSLRIACSSRSRSCLSSERMSTMSNFVAPSVTNNLIWIVSRRGNYRR